MLVYTYQGGVNRWLTDLQSFLCSFQWSFIRFVVRYEFYLLIADTVTLDKNNHNYLIIADCADNH